MTQMTETLGRPDGARRAVIGGIAVIAALAVAGGAVGVHALSGGEATAPAVTASSHDHAHRVGEEIFTEYGVVSVQLVDKSAGVPSKALAGATHYPSYVGGAQMSVQVTLTAKNLITRPTTVSADQFTLLSGKTAVTPRRVAVDTVKLQPEASFDEILSFTVPREGQPLTLAYQETKDASPILVDLGRAAAVAEGQKGTTAAPGADDHAHTTTPLRP